MSPATRRRILRANALFLAGFGAGSLVLLDVRAAFFGRGPEAALLGNAPYTAVGFLEAHGLAVVLGVLFARAAPSRSWHVAAAATHVLLGTCNLVFWGIFAASDVLLLGYVSTALHGIFVLLESSAAVASPRTAPGAGPLDLSGRLASPGPLDS